MNLTESLIGSPNQAGALVSFPAAASGPTMVTVRVGVSFVSAQQACANLQEEVGTQSFDNVVAASKSLWNQKLGKVELDLASTNTNVTEMFYSSMYRSFLTPNNATGEGSGAFAGTSSPFFDSLVSIHSEFLWLPISNEAILPIVLQLGVSAFACSWLVV